MIYEIAGSDVYTAIKSGATFIINSANGTRAMVSSNTPLEIVDIVVHSEDSFKTIVNSPEWRQPCVGC